MVWRDRVNLRVTNSIVTVFETTGNEVCDEGQEDDQLEPNKLELIIVIGFALKFLEKATPLVALRQILLQGRSAMTEVPKDCWSVDDSPARITEGALNHAL